MDCPACHEPTRWHETRPEKVCSKRHRVMPYVRPPRWKPGTCPDKAHHDKGPMTLLDSRDDSVWLCPEGHYLVLEGPRVVDHVSPSSLSTAETCMAQFYNAQVLRRREPPKWATEVGKFAHLTLEHLAREPDGARGYGDALRLAGGLWRDYAAGWEFQSLRLDDRWIKGFKWEAMKAVETALGLYPLNGRVVVEAEREFKEPSLQGTPVHGKIDLTLEPDDDACDLVVVDWKTGSAPGVDPPPAGSKNWTARHWKAIEQTIDDYRHKLRQAHIYVAATRQLTGLDRVQAELVYCKPGDEGLLIADPADTTLVMHDVRHTWQAIQAHQAAGTWPTNPSPLCGWCPYLAWDNGDGTFDFCASGVAYARDRMRSEYGWTRFGTNDPDSVPAVVTLRGLSEEQRRIAYALADAVAPAAEEAA